MTQLPPLPVNLVHLLDSTDEDSTALASRIWLLGYADGLHRGIEVGYREATYESYPEMELPGGEGN
jgi:hypothetical protein